MPRSPVERSGRRAAGCLSAVLLLVAGAIGCGREQRYRLLQVLFEDVPPPGVTVANEPVVRHPRRPPPPPPPPAPAPVAAPSPNSRVAQLRTWDDVVRLLPKDQAGNPDWTAAVDEGIIAPGSVLDPDLPEPQPAFDDASSPHGATPETSPPPTGNPPGPPPQAEPPDVEIVAPSDAAFDVVFSHRKHGTWLACANCHPDPFADKAGATPMTAGELHTQKYCASCHGKVAFEIGTSCLSCHLRTLPRDDAGRIDWTRALDQKRIAPRPGRTPKSEDQQVLDLDIEMTPPAQPALKSVFSHRVHTEWLACGSCHPDRFSAKARQAMRDTAELHETRYCGACHGSVSFGITGGCGHCHPALDKPRQHQERIDLNVPVTPRAETGGLTTLSHRQHRWVECATCHRDLFSEVPGATTMPKADIYGGKYCATCHGKVTDDLTASCRRCHLSPEVP